MSSDNNRRLVYSSGSGRVSYCKKCDNNPCSCDSQADFAPSETPVKLRLETKGRGGKAVTVVFNIAGNTKSLKAWAKKIKAHCGSGGSLKDQNIEVQGDHREKIKAFLEKSGFKVVLAGGRAKS